MLQFITGYNNIEYHIYEKCFSFSDCWDMLSDIASFCVLSSEKEVIFCFTLFFLMEKKNVFQYNFCIKTEIL